MKVAVRGKKERLSEWSSVVSLDHDIVVFESIDSLLDLNDYDAIFDLDFEEFTEDAELYANTTAKVFLSAVCVNLLEHFPRATVYGINALPTMIGRNLLEICGTNGSNTAITAFVKSLGWEDAEWVECRTGMVTPRIICMIINEAYYTVQEGTANKADIDKGMKLGTAYPKGPFEWCEEMGLANVYNVLDTVWQDTREERYKICPMLKSEFLKAHS